MAKAQGVVQNLGPFGQAVAANLKRLRGRVSFRELSDRLSAIGRPIPVLGLSRIETGARRVDVDDLLALALALGVPPVLLLVDPRTDVRVPFFEDARVPAWDVFVWIAGVRGLGQGGSWEPTRPPERELMRLLYAVANAFWQLELTEEGRRQLGGLSSEQEERQRTWVESLAHNLQVLRELGVPAPPRVSDDVRAAAQRHGIELPVAADGEAT